MRANANYCCEVVQSVEGLEPHRTAWEDLESRALEANYYFSPCFLIATLRHFAPRPFYVAFVYRNAPSERRLVACAPLQCRPPTLRIPTRVLSAFAGPHTFVSRPLVDRDFAGPALIALWNWIESKGHPWDLVRLLHMGPESATWAAIREELDRRKRPHWVKDRFQRAMLPRYESFDAFLSALPSSRRSSLRRQRKKLSEYGEVSVEVIRSPEAPADLARRFMELEQRGWKGEQGVGLLDSPASESFFTEIVETAARKGRVFFIGLRVDDRLVAMTANFTVAGTMFAFKVAHDPAFQKCSPGILAEIETIRAFHTQPKLVLGDSGTAGGSYLDDYWCDSREMTEVYLPTGRRWSRVVFNLIVSLTHAKRAVDAMLAELGGSTRFSAFVAQQRARMWARTRGAPPLLDR